MAELSPDDYCLICHLSVAEGAVLDEGWGGFTRENNPECRAPIGPRKPPVLPEVTSKMLDDLENAADDPDCWSHVEVPPLQLLALICLARQHIKE